MGRTKMLGAWFAVLLLVLTSACASVGSVPAKLQGVKTVGMISAIADELTVTPAGLTGIDSSDRTVAIASWALDDVVVGRVKAILASRFQVQDLVYRKETFAHPQGRSALPIFDLLREAPIKALVRTEVAPQGLDAYVVVAKATSHYGSRGHIISGIGVIDGNTLLARYAEVYALYTIWVIDGHSFEVIDKKSASPLDHSDGIRLTGPSRKLDPAVLSAADLAANDQLKAAVVDLVMRSLEATLKDLRLVGQS